MTAPNTHERPKVGVGVLVTHPDHPNCVLMGIRKTSSGHGLYAIPGGHLEFGEEWIECGKRETLEETGLVLKNMKYCTVVNDINKEENYHYVELFVRGEVDTSVQSEPINTEPDKCEGWKWLEWNNLPPTEKLFSSLHILTQNGFNPFNGT